MSELILLIFMCGMMVCLGVVFWMIYVQSPTTAAQKIDTNNDTTKTSTNTNTSKLSNTSSTTRTTTSSTKVLVVKPEGCKNAPASYFATFCCKDCTSVQGGNPHNGSYPNCMADGRIEHNGQCCADRELCMTWPNEHKYYMPEWKKCGYKSEVEKFPDYQCLRADMK